MSILGIFFGVSLILMGFSAIIVVDNPYEASQEHYPRITLLESITTVNMEGMNVPIPLMIIFGVLILYLDHGYKDNKQSSLRNKSDDEVSK